MLHRSLAWTLVVLTFASAGPLPDVKDYTLELALTVPDNESGMKVAQWTEDMNVNPEELGNYLEGDIMVTESTIRNGAKDPKLRWPNRIIPYVIQGNFNSAQMNLIREAIKDYEKYTCLRLKARTNEQDYVKITSDNTGCWSSIGRIGGAQRINLQIPGCVTKKGTVIHEIMHAAGFWHEHTRYDRDDYVTINWKNIIQSTASNFVKLSPNVVEEYGIPYDYRSVMHYSAYAFAIDTKVKTIVTKNAKAVIGQRNGFSPSDYQRINKMYKCSA
ncbi:PREDICTED: zinc metalloproteinase nas-4-like [Vollenhovia emeryi]|uniref:zinc metalloproteinase nas-4-like n=1 Tax=Vollenhovia emeryi TaxID=411798 RepID=UPI0005F4710E|nr:PREDICTED: zinc metalloproteinase nas-4-like [Vollenhovia emeryi]